MEIREQDGKVFSSREFPPGTAGPSRQGISLSFFFSSSSSYSFSPSSYSSSMSPKVAHLPQGNPPLCLPGLPAHTQSAGILPAGGESSPWEAFWSCPAFLFMAATGSWQCLCPGSFWGEGCVCFGRQSCPSQSPPSLLLILLPVLAEAPAPGYQDGPLLGAGSPSPSPPAWARSWGTGRTP